MNPCCKKWKKKPYDISTGFELNANFCPECGSLLEEEKEFEHQVYGGGIFTIKDGKIIGFKATKPKQENKECVCGGGIGCDEAINNICQQCYKPLPKQEWCGCVGGYRVFSGVLTTEEMDTIPCQLCGLLIKPKQESKETCMDCEYGEDRGSSIKCHKQGECKLKPRQEPNWCECENPDILTAFISGGHFCHICKKLMKPPPTPKLPEKVGLGLTMYFTDDQARLIFELEKTINKTLDYLKAKDD